MFLFIIIGLSVLALGLVVKIVSLRKRLKVARSKIFQLEMKIGVLQKTSDGNFVRFQKSDDLSRRTLNLLQSIFSQLARQIINPLPDNGLINLTDLEEKERLANKLYEISDTMGTVSFVSREVTLSFAVQGKDIIVNSDDTSKLEKFVN